MHLFNAVTRNATFILFVGSLVLFGLSLVVPFESSRSDALMLITIRIILFYAVIFSAVIHAGKWQRSNLQRRLYQGVTKAMHGLDHGTFSTTSNRHVSIMRREAEYCVEITDVMLCSALVFIIRKESVLVSGKSFIDPHAVRTPGDLCKELETAPERFQEVEDERIDMRRLLTTIEHNRIA